MLAMMCGLPMVAMGDGPVEKVTQAVAAGWEFRQVHARVGETDGAWRPAVVPGVVHADLLRNKLIGDPYYRDNESKVQWIERADWEYRTEVEVSAKLLGMQHVEMVLEGLDAVAEVRVNGALVLKADNMFREWRVDVKGKLKPGKNEIAVSFPNVGAEAAKVAATDPWRKLTQPLPAEKTYVRKAAFEYGWDWGPRLVTVGIWRPVRLEGWNAARISNLYVRQKDVSQTVARVVVEAEVTAAGEERAEVEVHAALGGFEKQWTVVAQLHAGVNQVSVPVEIAKPELWYPAGYGAHPLYRFEASVRVGGVRVDVREAKVGLRSIVLRRDVDEWGRSFELVVNGIPVFAKGADVIPFDALFTRVTTEQYRSVLESAVAANMNMVRHWGGGYYETDEFYAICDELGIMVWQDFMFGNEWQPGTYSFKLNVEKEAEEQVRRLRNHPSVVLWCGNNETETSWQWAQNADVIKALPADVQRHMWQDYLTLFSGVIARAVERGEPEVPYWPSSPSADYEDTSETYQSGDMHNWAVWHGMLPLKGYEKSFPRFMTEYGFQSFPEMRTVESFTEPEDRTGITTPVMLAHQKNVAGNQKIHEYMLRDYPEPKDFRSFLYVSQVLQAEAVKIGAEHLRRIRPRSMGSIYWQLNDCWPVASWSSLDYYGRWKALHYYARRFYNDVLVLPHEEDGGVAVYGVSDRVAGSDARLRVRLMTMDGKVLKEMEQAVTLPGLKSTVLARVAEAEWLKDADGARVFLVAELMAGGKTVSRNLLFFRETKDVRLEPARLETTVSPMGGGYRVRVAAKVLARDVYVETGSVDGKVSDNYFDVLPGEVVEIEVKTAAPEAEFRKALHVMSLTDAFAAGNFAAK